MPLEAPVLLGSRKCEKGLTGFQNWTNLGRHITMPGMTERELVEKVKKKLGKDCLVWQSRKKAFYPEQDVFGCFDLVVLKKGEISLIQVTTIQHISERMKKCRGVFDDLEIPYPTSASVWAYDKRKNDFVIKNLNDGKK
jgi:hypothetical protein